MIQNSRLSNLHCIYRCQKHNVTRHSGESSEAGAPGDGATTLDSGESGFPSDPSFGQESELGPPGMESLLKLMLVIGLLWFFEPC